MRRLGDMPRLHHVNHASRRVGWETVVPEDVGEGQAVEESGKGKSIRKKLRHSLRQEQDKQSTSLSDVSGPQIRTSIEAEEGVLCVVHRGNGAMPGKRGNGNQKSEAMPGHMVCRSVWGICDLDRCSWSLGMH